ncbi:MULTISPECIES: serine/threonine-protein kinase [Bacillus]|uniref:non-specific serine/threonine protein kinase n=1 Tax=Bacillus glycinifermentans TaxID=1664069 RepID=A0AAJ3YY26_9BACI|nr:MULTISPECIES: serine/threonine-protein kinase [Bacillus]MDU0072047.1 serine/threonine-protein kinase [Bacillus sp. IG6]MED8019694.1 serine/threonine-protein kinase [Bacillus glycinifermentans]QAT65206.1 serine/threonine protein kinase [Bacillus glycinifermentans]WKB79183.1 serine/threonine-protein kinase [Bacillus glycinifermentans]SCA85756.1 non-specific serine/threonine protein kinase [Bacillus glycinifermentans]
MHKINHVEAKLHLDKWKRIGSNEGMNSEVFIARDTQLDQVVILKKITKDSLAKQIIEDFFLEAKILNATKHPLIMPIHYAAEDEKNIYLTMPYYEKGSLDSLLNKRFLSPREIIKYALDFLTGLLFMHTKKILHLDIKPTNIIINNNDRAILTDFGLSRFLNDDGFTLQERQYHAHRSPESYVSLNKSVLDDIYQAGITLYRMCNGNDEFYNQFEALKVNSVDVNDMANKIKRGMFPYKQYLPHIPERFKRIVNKAIQPNPDNRYQSVLNIINDLSKVDEKLDWYYSYNKESKEFKWEYNNGKSIHSLYIKENEGSFLTSGVKYVINSERLINLQPPNGQFSSLDQASSHIEKMIKKYS